MYNRWRSNGKVLRRDTNRENLPTEPYWWEKVLLNGWMKILCLEYRHSVLPLCSFIVSDDQSIRVYLFHCNLPPHIPFCAWISASSLVEKHKARCGTSKFRIWDSIGLNIIICYWHHLLPVYVSKSGFILLQHKATTEANKPSPPSFVPLKWTVRVRLLNHPINLTAWAIYVVVRVSAIRQISIKYFSWNWCLHDNISTVITMTILQT